MLLRIFYTLGGVVLLLTIAANPEFANKGRLFFGIAGGYMVFTGLLPFYWKRS